MADSPEKKPSLGHAVKDGVVRFLSVSAIKTFDPETEGGCNRRWYFRYVMGKKEPETDAMKKGSDVAKQLEHYLKTGEDVLGPVARLGKKFLPAPGSDLEVEQPLGDIEQAVRLREEYVSLAKRADDAGGDGALIDAAVRCQRKVVEVAGLTAGGIPLMGAADFRHSRGEYVDKDGVLRKEERGLVVVEVGDHKTTKRINDHVTSGGRVQKGLAKTPSQIANDIQMLGYGVHAARRYPKMTHYRPSHIYYPTEGKQEAEKRTSLIPVEELWRRWHRIDQLAFDIEDVAKASRVEDVEPDLEACDVFRGCPYKEFCPRSDAATHPLRHLLFSNKNINQQGERMGLFGNTTPSPSNGTTGGLFGGGAAQQPPASGGLFGGGAAQQPASSGGSLFASLTKPQPATEAPKDATREAAIAAEKAKLLAEDTGKPSNTIGKKLPVTSCVAEEFYLVDCQDGKAPCKMQFKGQSKGFYFFVDEKGERARLEIADDVYTIETVSGAGSAVVPSDAPKPTLVESAAPPPESARAEIEDPALRQKVEEHATAHAAIEAEKAKVEASKQEEKKKGGGRCQMGNQTVDCTLDMLAEKEMTCVCGKKLKLSPEKKGDKWVATIDSHNRPKTEASVEPATTAQPTATTATPTAASAQTTAQSTATAQPPQQAALSLNGIQLFIDVAFERAPGMVPQLEDYYLPLVRELEEAAGAADIRCAPEKSELGFGKWKGALAAFVRARPPAPGAYLARSSSEIAQVVIETLSPACSLVVRGASR